MFLWLKTMLVEHQKKQLGEEKVREIVEEEFEKHQIEERLEAIEAQLPYDLRQRVTLRGL